MGFDAYIEITIEDERPVWHNCRTADPYYKNILYRNPETKLFPIINLDYGLEVKFIYPGAHIIGFEKSLLQDDHEIFLPYVYYQPVGLDCDDFDDDCEYFVGKCTIDLNRMISLDIEEYGKPYENIYGEKIYFDIDVIKIIIVFDEFNVKPTLDARLTKKEELYYKYIHRKGSPDPYVGLINPHHINTWSRSDDSFYWDIFPKYVYGCQFDRDNMLQYEPFQSTLNLDVTLEVTMDEKAFTTDYIDIGQQYYKNIVYRNSRSEQFPNICFRIFPWPKWAREYDLKVRLIGFQKSPDEDETRCQIHKVLTYDDYEGRDQDVKDEQLEGKIDLNEHIKPYYLTEINAEREQNPRYKNKITKIPSNLNAIKIIIYIGEYILKPSIDCKLKKKEELYYRYLYGDESSNPFKDRINPYDKDLWSKEFDALFWKSNKTLNLESQTKACIERQVKNYQDIDLLNLPTRLKDEILNKWFFREHTESYWIAEPYLMEYIKLFHEENPYWDYKDLETRYKRFFCT